MIAFLFTIAELNGFYTKVVYKKQLESPFYLTPKSGGVGVEGVGAQPSGYLSEYFYIT